jgi:hypothetical protein
MPAEPQHGDADQHRDDNRKNDPDENSDPGRDAVLDEQERTAVGADAEKDAVAEADLAGQAGDDVPRLRHYRVHENHDHQVQVKGVRAEQREAEQKNGQRGQ